MISENAIPVRVDIANFASSCRPRLVMLVGIPEETDHHESDTMLPPSDRQVGTA